MARKKKHRIGFDPLAWMKGAGTSAAPAGEPANASEADDASVQAPGPDPVAAAHAGETRAKEVSVPIDCSVPDTRTRIVNFGGALTIPKVAALHGELRQALEGGGEIVLDAAAVEAVDTAGLQLASVVLRAARERGVTVTWRAPSDILRQGAKRLDPEKVLYFPD